MDNREQGGEVPSNSTTAPHRDMTREKQALAPTYVTLRPPIGDAPLPRCVVRRAEPRREHERGRATASARVSRVSRDLKQGRGKGKARQWNFLTGCESSAPGILVASNSTQAYTLRCSVNGSGIRKGPPPFREGDLYPSLLSTTMEVGLGCNPTGGPPVRFSDVDSPLPPLPPP